MYSKTKSLSVFTLVMMITVSIDSIRNLSLTALFGTKLIFFFIVGGIGFLFPTGIIAAELTANLKNKSGIYAWTKAAFGQHVGFFSIWLQWVNTLVWYPTTLSFIAGSLLYAIDPAISQTPWVLTALITVIFWALTLVNLRGFSSSARFASFCAVIGLIVPLAFIIALSVYWVASGHPVQIHITPKNAFPSFHSSRNWTALVAILTSFLGMELISVHVDKVPNAQTLIPKAILISCIFILITMLAGALSIAVIIPVDKISLVSGIMEELHALLAATHLLWIQPLLALIIVIGALGSTINWIISPAQGLLQASGDHYIPPMLGKVNKHNVPARLLIIQALSVSLTASVFLLFPDINESYWLLTDLSTELYITMYAMMFMSAIYLYCKTKTMSSLMCHIGGRSTLFILCALGILSCVVTMIMGFVPPSGFYKHSDHHFAMVFSLGLFVMVAPCALGYFFQYYHKRRFS